MWSSFVTMTSTLLSVRWCDRRKSVNKIHRHTFVLPVCGLINAFFASTRCKLFELRSFKVSSQLFLSWSKQSASDRFTEQTFRSPTPNLIKRCWLIGIRLCPNIGSEKIHEATPVPLWYGSDKVGSHQSRTRILAKCCREPPSQWTHLRSHVYSFTFSKRAKYTHPMQLIELYYEWTSGFGTYGGYSWLRWYGK